METGDQLYYYHNDINGAPLRLTDQQGKVVWNVHYDIMGRIDIPRLKVNLIENPIRMQGQYEDQETGLYYNRYRYFDPNICAYVSQDPLGLLGGTNLYNYPYNIFGWKDPLGLIATSTPGYTVYGLYSPGSSSPYYVGLTNDFNRRRIEHFDSGRLPNEATMTPIREDVNYGQARGIEQANIEYNGTKTGTIGSDLSKSQTYSERGNKVNSFDVNSKTRDPMRQETFNTERQAELDRLNQNKTTKVGCP